MKVAEMNVGHGAAAGFRAAVGCWFGSAGFQAAVGLDLLVIVYFQVGVFGVGVLLLILRWLAVL